MLFHTPQRLSIEDSWQSLYNTSKHLYITLQKEAVSQLNEHNITWQLHIRSEEIVFYWFTSNWCFLNMVIRTNPTQWVLFYGDCHSSSQRYHHYCYIHNHFHLFYPSGIAWILWQKNHSCILEWTNVVSCPWWLIYMTLYLWKLKCHILI